MPRKRNLNLSEYRISGLRYQELSKFCMQYEEKKMKLKTCYGLKPNVLSDMPKSGRTSDPTSQQAEKAYSLSEEIEMIEQTAIEAAADLYQYILKNVTQCVPYECMSVPCSRSVFYKTRRYFFYLLDEKR